MREHQVCIDSAASWLCEARGHLAKEVNGSCAACHAYIVAGVDAPSGAGTSGEAVAWVVCDKSEKVMSVWVGKPDADIDADEWSFSANGQPHKPFTVRPLYAHPAPRADEPEVTDGDRQLVNANLAEAEAWGGPDCAQAQSYRRIFAVLERAATRREGETE